jgi:MFS family permease
MNEATATVPLKQDAQVIGLIGLAHGVSHFFHLILAPLFPLLKAAFNVSYAELGLLMSVFFVVSGLGQAAAGFVVDRFGARPVLFTGIALFGLSALGLASAQHYSQLLLFAGVAGLGNSVFHPVDYSLLNKHVSAARMSHAFSVHGISGTLGWTLAPIFLTGFAVPFGWRGALVAAAILAFAVLLLLYVTRERFAPGEAETAVVSSQDEKPVAEESAFDFLKLPIIWGCFAFFLLITIAFAGIQSFAPTALRELYGMAPWQAASCITAYMLCSAGGTLLGGFLAAKAERLERIIATALCIAGALALLVASALPPAFAIIGLLAVIGLCAGIAGPSRDLLVRRASPPGATGRVFGVVYSGLDSGLAIGPLIFGALMDAHQPALVFVVIAIFQVAGLLTATGVGGATARRASAAA